MDKFDRYVTESVIEHHLRDLYVGIGRKSEQIARFSLEDLLESFHEIPVRFREAFTNKYHMDILRAQRAVSSMEMPEGAKRYPVIKHDRPEVYKELLTHHIDDAYKASVHGAFDMARFSLEDAEAILSKSPRNFVKKFAPKIAKAKMDIFVDERGFLF